LLPGVFREFPFPQLHSHILMATTGQLESQITKLQLTNQK
jgi:hypothetical protein